MARGGWVRDPSGGGSKVPARLKPVIEERIQKLAEEKYAGRYTRIDVRFRGKFCYIDAYVEPPPLTDDWPPADWPESREEYIERLRNTPLHLCRLRYYSLESWSFALYGYSNEKYEVSFIAASGDFFGTLEQCFDTAAGMYLQ